MISCLNCKQRHLGCHDYCEDYQKFKKERENANKKEREFMQNWGWDGNLRFKMKARRTYEP